MPAMCQALHKCRRTDRACHTEILQLTHRSRDITQVQSRRVEQHSRAQNDRQPQNHSVAEAGRDLWRSSAPTPAPARPLKLPAVQLPVRILSLKDFLLYLRSEIQNVAAKIHNLPTGEPLLCSLLQAGKSC